ncbi:putative small intestine urate exporter, partial [Galemys pyrenaicus]
MCTQEMNLSIVMPAMVNHTASPNQPNASTEGPPTDAPDNRNETPKELQAVAPVYDWNPETQGIILSSINYGSILAPIPVGYVAGIFGAKYVVGAGLIISSVLSVFTPLAADVSVTLLVVLRVLQGIAEIMVLTGQFSIWVKWAPPTERSQLISIARSGGIGCACSFLWFLLFYEDPVKHPFISTGEKEYIVASLAEQDSTPGWSVPIKAMVKSLPLWVILVSAFCIYWRNFVVISYTPTYIKTVLQTNIRDSGILSALPMLAAFPTFILGGQLAGFLQSRNILTLNTIRKLSTCIGVLVPTGLHLALPWVRSSHSTSIAFMSTPLWGCDMPLTHLLPQSGILSALPMLAAFPTFILGGVLVPTGLHLALPWVRSSHSTSIAFMVLTAVFRNFSELGVILNMVDIVP